MKGYKEPEWKQRYFSKERPETIQAEIGHLAEELEKRNKGKNMAAETQPEEPKEEPQPEE